jgi:imidazolonepropionase
MPLKIIKNLKGIITPNPNLPIGELDVKEGDAILLEGSHIKAVEKEKVLNVQNPSARILDGNGCWAMPGFVDPHTHPVFNKTREEEFEMRIRGKSYEEIAQQGGGIRNSVRAFRAASLDQLTEITYKRIWEFLRYGTTTIEAKSGYGLSVEDELKSLRVLKKVAEILPITIIPTFLGAHEVPDEYQGRRSEYIDLVIKEMIPAVAEENLAKFCDVFTEDNVFSVEESEKILKVANDYGMRAKIHADELSYLGGAELAARVGAISADHLLMVSHEGIQAMKTAGVIPVLLPGTAFFLGKNNYAPARKMIEEGLPVALATDFNPGSSFTQNMNLILSIACTQMKMLPAETINASTLNSAKAVGLENELGSIEPGKKADIIFMDIPNFRYLPYHYGMNHVNRVMRHGEFIQLHEMW